MKVHQLARGLIFEHEPTSLTLGCKRLRPLASKQLLPATADTTVSSLDLKSFIRPERRLFTDDTRSDPPHTHVETHPGGTRWNPTQEQIGILEMLYRQGMRTPNAQQIEQITEQLSKYGKIEGKNVFYWFQNHKARERQKQKRTNTTTTPPLTLVAPTSTNNISLQPATNYLCSGREREEISSPYKRKCRSWSFESIEEDQSSRSTICRDNEQDEEEELRTLELFPLHPEGR